MKKLFLLFALAVVAMSCGAHCPSNEIWYTTTDGKKLFPNNTEPAAFGTLLVSNIYKDGQGVLTFDDDITLIGGGVFSDCTTLATITIPESVTEIGDFAFSGCSSLTSVTIGDSVTTIGDYAFCNCDNIASVKHPDSVTTVEREVFAKRPLRCKYADFLHLPHDLRGHFDFDEAVEEAKSVDMPILVYVKGHACNNCREMENVVWSDSKVLPMLQNDFVICALYVDDMTKVEGGKRLGSINSQLAQERWGINAQPAYILLSPDGKNVLAGPRGYDRDIDAFAEFLKSAL